jgi:uncharacterized membrane protein
MDITVFWRALAITGIIGLLILIVLWNGWLTPVQQFPRSIEIAILSIPLLFFVRGVLHGKRDTFIAATLLSFPYALIGIWYIFSSQESIYGYAMTLLSLCLFFGSLLNVWVLDKRWKEKQNIQENNKRNKKV